MRVQYELIKNPDRHIWEGWTVKDFIEELSIGFEFQHFENDEEIKKWCKDNMPYIKKHIPEVYAYFKKLAHDNGMVGERKWQ